MRGFEQHRQLGGKSRRQFSLLRSSIKQILSADPLSVCDILVTEVSQGLKQINISIVKVFH